MSSGKVKCTCGWSWNKSDSSKKDMYICHECGRDNSNNMKNGGWLDNYNDSEVSLPEGYVGEGYDTSGRDYSPAWGGQFEDGGLIPMAQKGKKVKPIYVESKNDPRYKAYQDSLRMYNYAQLQKQVEGVKNYKRGYNPPGFFGPDHADFEKHNFKALDDKTLEKLHKIYKDEKDGHYSKMTISQFKDVTKKMYNKANEITKSPNIAYINNASSPDLIAKNNDPIATYFGLGLNYDYAQPNQPIEVKKKETPKPTTTKETTKPSNTEWLPLTKEIAKGRYKGDLKDMFYRKNGKPSEYDIVYIESPEVKPQLQPRVEALNLRPIEQTPINLPVQELDFNTPIKAPKSYNVSSQRTNVNGINDFYNNVQQGVDYEQALKSKQSADAYNKYIQEKYGNEDALKNPKAVERLKQLKQNVEIVPQYQMGGSIPGSVGFTYARTNSPAPSNGKYAKKTMASAQNGTVKESTSVNRDRRIPSVKDVIKKVPGTKVYKDVYGNLLEKDDDGVYKPRQKEKEEVRKHVPQSKLSKAKEIALNPMTAAGYKVRNEDIPENFSRSEDTRNNLDTAVDFINPAWYAESAKNLVQNQGQVFSDVSEGNFQDAALNQTMAGVEALNFIPLAKGAKPLLNKAGRALGTESGLLSNASNFGDKTKSFLRNNVFTDKTFNRLETINNSLNKSYRAVNPFHHIKAKKSLDEANQWMDNWYNDPITKEKIKEVSSRFGQNSFNEQQLLENIKNKNYRSSFEANMNKVDNFLYGSPRVHRGNSGVSGWDLDFYKDRSKRQNLVDKYINPDMIKSTAIHEGNHGLTNGNQYIRGYEDVLQSPFDTANFKPRFDDGSFEKYSDYLLNPTEINARLSEIRYEHGLKPGENLTPERVNSIIDKGISGKSKVDAEFFNLINDRNKFKDMMNYVPAAVPIAGGIGIASQMQNEEEVPGMRKGGVIKDDRGQWNHPGEITEIGSNQITMQGVPYPVLGVSDTGDTKLMKPGKNYKFKGKKVTEFPMAKNGIRQEQKGLVNLDQLTNFTNYNTKQPGGWMDKYQ